MSLSMAGAKRLGWTIHEGRKPELVPFEGSYRVRRGFLSAEKTIHNGNGYAYTRRVEVETHELDGWRDLQKRLLREIEKVETLIGAAA